MHVDNECTCINAREDFSLSHRLQVDLVMITARLGLSNSLSRPFLV